MRFILFLLTLSAFSFSEEVSKLVVKYPDLPDNDRQDVRKTIESAFRENPNLNGCVLKSITIREGSRRGDGKSHPVEFEIEASGKCDKDALRNILDDGKNKVDVIDSSVNENDKVKPK